MNIVNTSESTDTNVVAAQILPSVSIAAIIDNLLGAAC